MDTAEVGVLIGGILLIGFVIWYFFAPRKGTTVDVGHSGVQEISIMVKGGYSPDVVIVKPGIPVRLNFYRDETAACSEQVVFSDFGIVRDLPAFQHTTIEFTAEKPGEYTFTCGMNMMRGKLVAHA